MLWKYRFLISVFRLIKICFAIDERNPSPGAMWKLYPQRFWGSKHNSDFKSFYIHFGVWCFKALISFKEYLEFRGVTNISCVRQPAITKKNATLDPVSYSPTYSRAALSRAPYIYIYIGIRYIPTCRSHPVDGVSKINGYSFPSRQ